MRSFILGLLSLCFFTAGFSQVSSVEFGKNRVQYHQDYEVWSQYESRNFITYWYGEGRYIGQAVVQMAEYDFLDIENILEHRINDKIEIIVYTDLTDLKQSNIGSEEAFMNIGGQTKIVGNKMFVYFNGDHNHLRRQIREGVASVYLNAMLFGSNLQEIVQNAVMMNLPEWFKEGLIAFVGQEWSTELDNELRDLMLSGQYETFDELAEEDPRLAGHSLWYFISQNFGTSTVSNLLYLTRINRSVESGFLYVLGSPFPKTTQSWYSYFTQRYEGELRDMDQPAGEKVSIKNKKNLPISQVQLSPDGKKLVYVMNDIGRYKVYLHDLETDKREKIFKLGFRNAFQATDYNYPLITWNPGGTQIAIIYEQQDEIKMLLYDVFTKDRNHEVLSTQYQRIYSIDYINNFDLVFSAAVRGYSDIFIYYTKTRQTQRITNDFWDDLDATFVKLEGQPGLIFASNRADSLLVPGRMDTILPITNYDLYYFDLKTQDAEMIRLTRTPYANERYPQGIDDTYFSYLSDQSGIYNRFSGYLEEYLHHYDKVVFFQDGTELTMHPDSALTTKLDSVAIAAIDTVLVLPQYRKRAVTYPVTNYDRNIESQFIAHRSDKIADLITRDGIPEVYIQDLPEMDQGAQLIPTLYHNKKMEHLQRFKLREKNKKEANRPIQPEKEKPKEKIEDIPKSEPDTGKIDIDNYLFQSEFDDTEMPPQKEKKKEEEVKTEEEVIASVAPPMTPKAKQGDVIEFKSSRIVPYRLKFRTDFVTTQLDNDFLFDGLNSFAGTPQEGVFPPPGILLKANFKDLFEDYQLEGGIRVPTTFNGAEYFLLLDDKKKRMDKRYAVYRRASRFSQEGSVISPIQPRSELNTFLMQYQLRYPLDIFNSIRAIGTMRFDNTVQLATDSTTLGEATLREQRIGARLEYVFDNTLDVSINIKNGSRAKVYAEMVKGFNLQFSGDPSFNFKNGFLGVVGVDARHYQPIFKHSVLAARFAAASTFGSERILYYLGGVDSWLLPRYNNDIPVTVPEDFSFAYQTAAANLRGFRLNIRNGNSYALLNTEVRIPIFRYISKNIRSNFLRNLQLVGFYDVGTAWIGPTPFSDDNPLNIKEIPDPPVPSNPVTVTVRFFRDPIVMGYGAGLRAVLFGYFLRVDYGWGVETKVVQEPRLYISLGLDF